MQLSSHLVLLLAAVTSLGSAQNCPLIGPAYPAATDVVSPTFTSAKAAMDKALAQALTDGQVNGSSTYYSLQVFTPFSRNTIYEAYHTASNQTGSSPVTVGPDTVFRIFSISKVISVYATLAALGDKYWNEPVVKYVPELEAALKMQGRNAVDDADWNEITLGSLSSLMSGLGRDCAYPLSYLHCRGLC
jgi:CubicO group peptidase (beta-lactamase class C family)